MSELSGHDCPRCNVELYIEMTDQAEGVDLLICKECWGVGVAAKSMESVITKGEILDGNKDDLIKRTGICKCPMCSTNMDVIELDLPKNIEEKLKIVDKKSGIYSINNSDISAASTKKVVIDSCSNCPTFWFDAGELDLLNGIQPKMRGISYDPTTNRLMEDQSLTEDDLKKKDMKRKGVGGFFLISSLALFGSVGILGKAFLGLVGLGGLIAVLSKNPNQKLAIGTCDKCLKEDKSLAWNCQRGGCWAHICNDCQTIGADPVETYAKTLGTVAAGTVMVGIGILAVVAVAESGGAGLNPLDLATSSGGSKEKTNRSEWKNMLLCQECVEVAKEEEKSQQLDEARKLQDAAAEDRAEQLTNDAEITQERNERITRLENAKKTIDLEDKGGPYVRVDDYCEHVDAINGKKCRRVTFRNLNYCYEHK